VRTLTYCQIKEYIEQQGYVLLSKEYRGSKTSLNIQCPRGHQYGVTWTNFQQGYRCPKCKGEKLAKERRLSLKKVEAFIRQQGYTLLSEKYKNASTKLEIQCNKGHQYQVIWINFKQGYRCPHCAGNAKLTYEQVKEYIETYGYFLLSETYKRADAKLSIQCPEGHRYKATWSSFRQGHRCPYCAGQIVEYEQVKEYVKAHGYFLLSENYKNTHGKLLYQCPKGHQYQASWVSFQQGHRCSKCNQSRGEEEIAKILNEHKISFIRQYRLPRTRLSLDFFLPDLEIGIEYDGQQHFEPVQFGGISLRKAQQRLKKQQQRDIKKDKICRDLGIVLLRVKYTDSIKRKLRKIGRKYDTRK
jgi:very-short-patch-repair endonuclease/DNA-directed RNA polymerase subunit RPC12/RpoP